MGWVDVEALTRGSLERYFDSEVSAALTPFGFRSGASISHFSRTSRISLAFSLHDPAKGTTSYAREKVPGVLKQWGSLEADASAVLKVFGPLYEVIRGNADKLYGGMKLTGDHAIPADARRRSRH